MRAFELKLHAEAVVYDLLLDLVPAPFCISPVVVRLHHHEVEAEFLAALDARSHCIWHPVEAFAYRMAVIGRRLDGLVVLLVFIAEAARSGELLGKNIESYEFDMLIFRICELRAHLVDHPLICLDTVLCLCEIHLHAVDLAPIHSIPVYALHGIGVMLEIDRIRQ